MINITIDVLLRIRNNMIVIFIRDSIKSSTKILLDKPTKEPKS